MNHSMVFYLLGWIALCEAVLLLLPAAVALIYGERCLLAFLATALLCALIGFVLTRRKPKNRVFYLKEGFVVTALSWVLISVLGAVPFLLTDAIPNPIDALFETDKGESE